MDKIKELREMAKSYSLEFTDKGNGHIQLSNHGNLINYWPNSKKQTVHTKSGETHHHCSNYDAIKLCLNTGIKGLKPKKGVIAENKPHHDFIPRVVNRCGVKHFYNGEKPPWEFPTMVQCWPDILRSDAQKLIEQAEHMECPQAYQDAAA